MFPSDKIVINSRSCVWIPALPALPHFWFRMFLQSNAPTPPKNKTKNVSLFLCFTNFYAYKSLWIGQSSGFFFLDRLVGFRFGHSPISNCNVNCFSGFLCVIWCGRFLEGWKCKCYYVVWKPHFQCLPDNRKGLQFSAFSACWVLAVLFSSFCAVTVCVIPFRIQKEVSMCAWTRFWDLEGNTLKGITGKQDSVYICTWSDMWERWDLCFPTN